MADPLARFWVHQIQVRRKVGSGAYGPVFDPAADQDADTFLGWVEDGTKLVADGNGGQVASSARVACPASTPYVPVGSEITLPPQYAAPGQTRVTKVIAVGLGDGGGLPTPDHMTLALL